MIRAPLYQRMSMTGKRRLRHDPERRGAVFRKDYAKPELKRADDSPELMAV
jgi:hypothetical protein